MWICVLPGERRGQGVLSSAATAPGFDGRLSSSLSMGPNEKLLKHAREHGTAHHNLCIFADVRKKTERLIRDITPQRSLLLLNARERGRVSGYPFIVTSVVVLLRLGEHRIGLGIALFAMGRNTCNCE